MRGGNVRVCAGAGVDTRSAVSGNKKCTHREKFRWRSVVVKVVSCMSERKEKFAWWNLVLMAERRKEELLERSARKMLSPLAGMWQV